MTATVATHHVSLPRHGDQGIARRVKLLVSKELQRPAGLDPFVLQPSAL